MSSFSKISFGLANVRVAVLTVAAAGLAAYIVPAMAGSRTHPLTTQQGPLQVIDNNTGDAYALQAVAGGQNNATALEGYIDSPSAVNDNGVLGYTVAGGGNAIVGIAQPSSGAATGLVGSSSQGDGVIGAASYSVSPVVGVLGQDNAGTSSTGNAGVMGTTTDGVGVSGTANGTGGWGGSFSATSYGMYATSSGDDAGRFVGALDGVYGITTYNSTTFGGVAGVQGLDSSLFSTAVHDSGVLGASNFGTGVIGQSGTPNGSVNAGSGIIGVTYNNSSMLTNTSYGVVGTDSDPHSQTADAGVYGSSINGFGIQGVSTTSAALDAVSGSGAGLIAISNSGRGAVVYSGSTTLPALYVQSLGSSSTAPAIIANSQANGGEDIFSVADDGTVTSRGAMISGGTPLVETRQSSGRSVLAYGARQTVPTIEDFGEGTLVNGVAEVRLQPDFAASIDRSRRYLVFVTAMGPADLYVAHRSADGFVIRSFSGDPNVDFDYRIVAKPAFENGSRLPDVRTLPSTGRPLGNPPRELVAQSPAQVAARDRALRATIDGSTMSAAERAAGQASMRADAARIERLKKIKAPHIPTAQELHLPTPHTHS
jgi:hypothetical protein